MTLRRLPFVVAIVAGASLLAICVLKSSFDSARAGDRLIRLSAPVLTDAGLHQLRTELDDLVANGKAFREVALPRLAELSHEDVATFNTRLRSSAPEVVTGIEQLPAIEKQADGVVTNLNKRQHEFESAKALPGGGLNLRQGAVAALVLAGLLVVVGIVGLRRPRRGMAVGLAVLGALLVIVPLAVGYPSKASDTDAVLDSLRPFTVAKVEARQRSLATIENLLAGLRGKVIPATAAAAGLTPDQVAADLSNADPTKALSAAGQAKADKALEHFVVLVKFSGTIQPLLVQTSELPARTTTWMLLLPGAALLLAGAAGARSRDRS